MGPRLAPYIALELQRLKGTVWCVKLVLEVPGVGHNKGQLTQTLIVRLLKTHFFLSFQKLGGPRPYLAPTYDPYAN